MKICLIGPTYPFRGGISHYTTLLFRNLKKKHDVSFFSFKRQYPLWLFPGKTDIDPSQIHIQEKGIQRILDSMNPITWLIVAWKIAKLKSDLLIIPWWVSFWAPQFLTISILVKLFSETKILFLCHNVVEHESKWIDRILTRSVLKKGNYFIVHSQEDHDNLKAVFPHANVRKTFHPTYDVFNLSDFDPQEIRKCFGITGNVLLFFGFVREYKGLKYLLEAVPKVLSKVPVTLLVVGEFWKDKDYYIDLVDKLRIKKNVIFVDEYVPNEEVGKYFSAADLVVQPYISATGSGIIQIAFGFHKPVVATQVGCLPEVVKDGETGYLVSPESSSDIATAIIKFFQKKQAEEFAENIKKDNYRFSWNRMVDVVDELASI